MRAYLLATGLAILVVGLFLLFAGYVHIGCSVGGTGMNPTFSNCGGATDLELAGATLSIVAVVLFAAGFIPEHSSSYK